MLLQELIIRQKRMGYTDGQYAQFLGVPRSTWTRTRLGGIPVGRRVALAVRRVFPDLRREAESFLLSDAHQVPESDTTQTGAEPETATIA